MQYFYDFFENVICVFNDFESYSTLLLLSNSTRIPDHPLIPPSPHLLIIFLFYLNKLCRPMSATHICMGMEYALEHLPTSEHISKENISPPAAINS